MTDEASDTKRWRGFTHKDLYQMLFDGPGAQASAEASRRWAELSATLHEVGQDLQTAIEASGSGWNGRAAGAAYDKLAPLAGWAQTVGAEAETMRAAVEHQAEYIATARAEMPAPEGVTPIAPDPTVPPPVLVGGAQNDKEPVESAQSADEQRAFEVMAAYEKNTSLNLSTLTTFEAPVELVESTDLHSDRGTGVDTGTSASGFAGGTPAVQVGHGGGGGGHYDGRGLQGVGVSGATGVEAEVVRKPVIAPGAMVGATPHSQISGGYVGGRYGGGGGSNGNRSTGRGAGARGIPMGGASPTSAGSTLGSGSVHDFAASSAAGGAMANGAGGGMGAGGAMGAGGGTPGDRLPVRRFGTDALGSSQWFGDTDDLPGRSAPAPRRRNRDAREDEGTEQVTESVSVDGQQHQLPPTVIGGGQSA